MIIESEFEALLSISEFTKICRYAGRVHNEPCVSTNTFKLDLDRYAVFHVSKHGITMDIPANNNTGCIHNVFRRQFWETSKLIKLSNDIEFAITFRVISEFISSRIFKDIRASPNKKHKEITTHILIKYINGDIIASDINGNNKYLLECKHGVYAYNTFETMLMPKDFDADCICKYTVPYFDMCELLNACGPDCSAMWDLTLMIHKSGLISLYANKDFRNVKCESENQILTYKHIPEIWTCTDDIISIQCSISPFKILCSYYGYIDYNMYGKLTFYINSNHELMISCIYNNAEVYCTIYSDKMIKNAVLISVMRLLTLRLHYDKVLLNRYLDVYAG